MMSDFTSLDELGLSESALKNIATVTSCQSLPPSLSNAPSHGVLLGLLVFAKTFAKVLKCKPNRILKCLVDTLFPTCSVARADRLLRKVQNLSKFYDTLSTPEEKMDYLQQTWKPCPTGTLLL